MSNSKTDQVPPSQNHGLTIEQFGEVNTFGVSGRIGRLRYFTYTALPIVLLVPSIFILLIVIRGKYGVLDPHIAKIVVISSLLIVYAYLLIKSIQRVHDFNRSGWLSLLIFIPFVPLVYCFIPGTDGENQYGLPTPPNTIKTVLLTSVVPVLIIVPFFLAIAIPAYQGYEQREHTLRSMEYHHMTLPAGNNVITSMSHKIVPRKLASQQPAIAEVQQQQSITHNAEQTQFQPANQQPTTTKAQQEQTMTHDAEQTQHLRNQALSMFSRHTILARLNQASFRFDRMYRHRVARMVARAVREVRIQREQSEQARTGQPVALATGRCKLQITIRGDGSLEGTRWHCSSISLGHEMIAAVHRALPFPPAPHGKKIEVSFMMKMGNPTPGISGE